MQQGPQKDTHFLKHNGRYGEQSRAAALRCGLGRAAAKAGSEKGSENQVASPRHRWGSKARALQASRAGKYFYGVVRSRSRGREEEVHW